MGIPKVNVKMPYESLISQPPLILSGVYFHLELNMFKAVFDIF